MAQEREYFKEALLTYQQMSADEKMQLELEGREAYRMDIQAALETGEERGEKRGEKRGLDMGLKSLVDTLKSFNLSKEEICNKVRANQVYQDLSDEKILEFY